MAEDGGMHCIVTGLVQGVFFRKSTQDKAKSLSLTGWVKNLADGSVELEAYGSAINLEELYKWLYQGPSDSKVEKVTRDIINYEQHDDFKIRY